MFMSSYYQRNQLPHLNKSIECHAQVVALAPRQGAQFASRLIALARSHLARFLRMGELNDIQRAIDCYNCVQPYHLETLPSKLSLLVDLGTAYCCRFERLARPADINISIQCMNSAVLLIPLGHSNMPQVASQAGVSYLRRYAISTNVADLETSIQYFTRAVSSETGAHAKAEKASWLSNLGVAFSEKFRRLCRLEDIAMAIHYQLEAQSLTPDGHQNNAVILSSLGSSYRNRFEVQGEREDAEQSVACHARAVELTPTGSTQRATRLNNLGNAYSARSEFTDLIHDLDMAINSQNEAVSQTPEDHIDYPSWLYNLGTSYAKRYQRLEVLSDIDKAIDCQSRAVSLMPSSHQDKYVLLHGLGNSLMRRYSRLNQAVDAHTAIESLEHAVSLIPESYAQRPMLLGDLGKAYIRRSEVVVSPGDLQKGITLYRQSIAIATHGSIDKSRLQSNLGAAYMSRYMRSHQLEDIDDSIDLQKKGVSLIPDENPDKARLLARLASSLMIRYEAFGGTEFRIQSLDYYKMASKITTGNPRMRFEILRGLANATGGQGRSECLTSYDQAIRLLPQVAWLGSTVAKRHENLVEVGDITAEAAHIAIGLGEYDKALEWMEAGHSIVWRQTLQLRTPLHDLSKVDPELARKFKHIFHELSIAGFQSQDGHEMLQGPSAEEAAQRHRRVAESWDSLLGKIRLLPGFRDFLMARDINDLKQAARNKIIVMVNLHRTRCDALILTSNSANVQQVDLSEYSYEVAINARLELLNQLRHAGLRERSTRRPVPTFDDTETEFKNILAGLWNGIVKPIFAHVGCLSPAPECELPHVVWCLAGPLAFLPIHAAGVYDEPTKERIFDYAISSYTPTLNDLLPRESVGSETGSDGILVVTQPHTEGCSPLPGTVAEAARIREQANNIHFELLESQEATTLSVLEAMERNNWVHLACHALQDSTDPMSSGFHLTDGLLKLSTIANASFSSKGLAFLSACQTATGDPRLPNEAVHLAAGMIVAGYGSVIATMWSIRDEDAPTIAEQVYSRLLLGGRMDNLGVAKAVHEAVKILRCSVGDKEFGRWVPYIHVGG